VTSDKQKTAGSSIAESRLCPFTRHWLYAKLKAGGNEPSSFVGLRWNMSYLVKLSDSYLLIAGAILLLAILFIEYRLSRIAFKLDKTNAYLARADQLLAQLAEQTGHLEALALNAASRSAIAAQTPPATRSAHAAGRESARDAGSPGPTEF